MSPEIPAFAVVGHPNEGKSSVVATLTENDSVGISPYPGETVENREFPVRIDDRTVLRFIDTPGFQHPRGILRWFRENEPDRAGLARRFLEAHVKNSKWHHDHMLLEPVARGLGILHVLDGSRPLSSTDRVEMEILRLCGNPRMAVINPKEACTESLEEWKDACARCFSTVRIFDAHQATFVERIALLESLRAINQEWEAQLGEVITVFRQDWDRRITQAAHIIVRLLERVTRHTESVRVPDPEGERQREEGLKHRYRQAVRKLERESHERIRRLYRHHVFDVDLPEQSLLAEDLFTSRTWQVLGLRRHQLITAAGLLGGGLGAKIDLMFAGLSFGTFTLGGAALAVLAGWLKGERLASIRIVRLPIGGTRLTIGPSTNPQFPFILVDRALLYFRYISTRPHVWRREDDSRPRVEEPQEGYTTGWDGTRRRLCLRLLSPRLSFREEEKAREGVCRLLEKSLRQCTESVPKGL